MILNNIFEMSHRHAKIEPPSRSVRAMLAEWIKHAIKG
jgi:hypothetical protein